MQTLCKKGCDHQEYRDKVEEEILRLTNLRGTEKSICPSEVARSVFSTTCWRIHMPFVRQLGFELALQNKIEACQKGVAVSNPSEETIKGPLRFRLKKA